MIKQKILILGGTGFIGNEVVKQLKTHSANFSISLMYHNTFEAQRYEGIMCFNGSLEKFDPNWLKIIQPDIIIHLARMAGRTPKERQKAAEIGAESNYKFIEQLKNLPKKPRLIYVSGTLMYGSFPNETIVDESFPLNPFAYAKDYIKAEMPFIKQLSKQEIPITFLRPAWVLGSESWFKQLYLSYIKQHKQVPLFGAGDKVMSLISVADCAGLIIHALNNSAAYNTYNLFTPNVYPTKKQFSAAIAQHLHCSIEPIEPTNLAKKYGEATAEALNFSSKIDTIHEAFINSYSFKHTNLADLIKTVL